MPADNFLGYIQTQTGPFGSAVGHLKELLKNSRVVFPWNAFAGVGDGEAHGAVSGVSAQCDAALSCCMTHRVADEIGEHMADPLVIGQHFDLGDRETDAQMQALGIRLHLVFFDCFVDEI